MSQENLHKNSMKGPKMNLGQKISSSDRQKFVEAIDNLFLKLELSYHYQFYKVFGTDERLSEAKRLWAESLKNSLPPAQIMQLKLLFNQMITFLRLPRSLKHVETRQSRQIFHRCKKHLQRHKNLFLQDKNFLGLLPLFIGLHEKQAGILLTHRTMQML